MEEINACAGQVRVMTRALTTLTVLREKIPAYESLLTPGRLGAALRDPAIAESFNAELVEMRETHLGEVTAVLASQATT